MVRTSSLLVNERSWHWRQKEPLFVIDTDVSKNIVYVGQGDIRLFQGLFIKQVTLGSSRSCDQEGCQLHETRIRYVIFQDDFIP